jgi:shikimate dehydrogenase
MARFGLIGKSLRHSFSKGYFREKFQKEGSDHSYENFELESIADFPNLLSQNPDIKGLNVTIPYKESIIPYLDDLDPVAREIGAVNTVLISEGRTEGFNTDVIGFKNSLKPFLKHGMEKALILGTGGASKAVAYVLKYLGINCFFVSREPGDAKTLAYDLLNREAMKQFRLIVNTTPLGTFPDIDEFPKIPYEYLTVDHLLYDLIYNPSETVFLKKGKEMGATTLNGLGMLKSQAEASYKIWLSESE